MRKSVQNTKLYSVVPPFWIHTIKRGWMVWFAVINVAKFELIVHWNRKSWLFVFRKIVRKLFLRHFELTFVSKNTFNNMGTFNSWMLVLENGYFFEAFSSDFIAILWEKKDNVGLIKTYKNGIVTNLQQLKHMLARVYI